MDSKVLIALYGPFLFHLRNLQSCGDLMKY